MNLISKKIGNMVKKYNNTYHRTIKMKPVDAKLKTYFSIVKDNHYKNLKFKVGDYKII